MLNFVGAFISLEVAATVAQDIVQGFAAQGAGAATILASTSFGFPLSTTQVISG